MTTWTPERRARQAELIRATRPWERSTGPTSDAGKAASSRNAYKGGNRPRSRRTMAAMSFIERLWRSGLSWDLIAERTATTPGNLAALLFDDEAAVRKALAEFDRIKAREKEKAQRAGERAKAAMQ